MPWWAWIGAALLIVWFGYLSVLFAAGVADAIRTAYLEFQAWRRKRLFGH